MANRRWQMASGRGARKADGPKPRRRSFARRKNPWTGREGDLGRHRCGSGSRAGFGLRGRRVGLDDAGNEAIGQLDRTLHGAARVEADGHGPQAEFEAPGAFD